MARPNISIEEQKTRVSALLRQVDEDVRKKNLEDALDKIRKVYEYDIKNIYARAYEERILIMILERDREQAIRAVEKSSEERVNAEVKKRLRDFYRQQELSSEKRKQSEQQEQVLEDRARKASVTEARQESKKDISKIETDTTRQIEELEQRLLQQIQKQSAAKTDFSSIEAVESQRKKIEDEAFSKMKDEHRRAQEQLVQRMDEERKALLEREHEKAKQSYLDAYCSLMALMMELAVPSEFQAPLLQSLKISFSLTDEEHAVAERDVRVRTYIETIRRLYQLPQQSEEDFAHLKNLRKLFGISDEEHKKLVKRVKKELGLPDETAVILIIDDDPAIRKFVEHVLQRTYKTVQSTETAEAAISAIQAASPSLVLCDINLGIGVMSGFTFCEKIRAGELGAQLKSLPMIFMSSMVDEFFIKSAKQLGVKEFLPKPFSRESLEAVVKNTLE
ncbi:MAG: response regulator [Bacteroidota bacterium]